jgi:hypothetical protein
VLDAWARRGPEINKNEMGAHHRYSESVRKEGDRIWGNIYIG